ncbi:MAG: hypothetical protein U0X91_25835 [Spirosomataceae bacterium]
MRLSLLRLASIFYLLFPNLIFAAAWFRIEIAVPMIISLGLLFWLEIKESDIPSNKPSFLKKELLILALIAFIITGLTGISGYSYQLYDYWAENTKFYDLYKSDWPLYFRETGRYACYYFGYYLIPSFISKLSGELCLPALFIWSWAGVFIVTVWLYFLTDKKIGNIFIVLSVGGLSSHLKWLLTKLRGVEVIYSSEMGPAVITPLFHQLRWAPNQVIACLIASSLLLYSLFWEKKYTKAFFAICLCSIWCIFPTLVLFIVFAGFAFYALFKEGFAVFFKHNTLTFILCLCFMLPILVYFSSSNGDAIRHFFLQVQRPGSAVPKLLLDIGIDVGLLFIGCFAVRKTADKTFYYSAIISLFFLFLLRTYRFGAQNDLFMRGQIPLLFIVAIFLIRNFNFKAIRFTRKSGTAYLLVACYLLLSPWLLTSESLIRSIQYNKLTQLLWPTEASYTPLPFDAYKNTYQMLYDRYSPAEAKQYLGKKNSVYERYLVRKK